MIENEKFVRNLVTRNERFGIISVPSLVFKEWTKNKYVQIEMKFNENDGTLLLIPVNDED